MKKIAMTKIAAACAIAAASLLTGCASIVNGTNQVVSVETRHKGEPVSGVTCKLDNGKGVFYVTTPGTVTVHRAYDDLSIKCEKDNVAPGLASVKSSTKAMAFGNILFGGVIGAAVDAGSGAAYDYPAMITVLMGETVKLPATPAAPAAIPAQAAVPPADQPAPSVTK